MPAQVLESGNLKVTLEPISGRRHEIIADPGGFLENSSLRSELSGVKHRVLSFQTEDDEETDEPMNFVATVYDYTNRRTLVASGSVDDPSAPYLTLLYNA